MARILVVEDEDHIANGLKFNLELDGHSVDLVGDGRNAYDIVTSGTRSYDLVVLDVMLPSLSGFDVCRGIRKQANYTPILILTAKSFEKDKVFGLQVGADDYMTKPFNLEELLARVGALLRRRDWDRRRPAGPSELRFRDVVIDFDRAETQIAGESVKLTAIELKVMRALAAAEGRVVSREELMEVAWNLSGPVNTRTVDNFIMRLRRLFEADPSNPRHILSVRGEGYRLLTDEAS
ncbi:MAG: response regulator transcription factor [Candidatus Sericytochromatia bacterium]|nr:response regulator transcription factor [Candidatus Tanganyikabacteria bacterium]